MQKQFLDSFTQTFSSNAYDYLGSFYSPSSTVFRVYAPNASCVSVVGDFNNWNVTKNIMKNIGYGIWETDIKKLKIYDNYKYAITFNSNTFLKQDPYALHNQTDGESSSKIYPRDNYTWNDQEWFIKKETTNIYQSPINIYEVHVGSWMKKCPSYKMLAHKLIPYAKKMGYTHIELLPVMEHPFLGSWGYQVTGYFSITSRYGTPDEFKYFVDYAHQKGIGIILDWVPAHFPKDAFGLYEFDGTYLYEDPVPERMEHKSWGTRIFNYGKPEIKSFLISSACFYFKDFHIDGLRVDAVAAMVYLDYDRKVWKPNVFGGNYNLEAIDFLKDLNQTCFQNFNNILMIAEESTAFPKVTHPIHEGGLGFNFKWNMGWMNDTLSYAQTDPYFRSHAHNKMTFAMSYAHSENYILPISHDEVVHGKLSLLNKMPGEYDDKFANLRIYLGYMLTHPGKKLLFMGCEFGQYIEWNEKKELDWLLLDYPRHKELQHYVKNLNKLYLKYPQLYVDDKTWEGFNWINPDDSHNNTYSYIRKAKNAKDIIVIINFSGKCIENYELRNNNLKGSYKVILSSDEYCYGGNQLFETEKIKANKGVLKVSMNKLSLLILKKV